MMRLEKIIADHYGPMTAKTYDEMAFKLFWAYRESLEAVAAEVVYGRRSSPDEKPQNRNILDVGVGTGNLSLAVAQELIAADCAIDGGISITGYDGSTHMGSVATEKLATVPGVCFELKVGDLRQITSLASSPPFDCIVSSYALHHLDASEKATFFLDLAKLLTPGGLVVIADRMPPQDECERSSYHATVASKILAELFRDANEKPPLSAVMDELSRRFDEDGDKPSTVDEHIQFMKAAGFSDIRCPWMSFGAALVSGRN